MLMEPSIECGSVDDMLGRLGAARKEEIMPTVSMEQWMIMHDC